MHLNNRYKTHHHCSNNSQHFVDVLPSKILPLHSKQKFETKQNVAKRNFVVVMHQIELFTRAPSQSDMHLSIRFTSERRNFTPESEQNGYLRQKGIRCYANPVSCEQGLTHWNILKVWMILLDNNTLFNDKIINHFFKFLIPSFFYYLVQKVRARNVTLWFCGYFVVILNWQFPKSCENNVS